MAVSPRDCQARPPIPEATIYSPGKTAAITFTALKTGRTRAPIRMAPLWEFTVPLPRPPGRLIIASSYQHATGGVGVPSWWSRFISLAPSVDGRDGLNDASSPLSG